MKTTLIIEFEDIPIKEESLEDSLFDKLENIVWNHLTTAIKEKRAIIREIEIPYETKMNLTAFVQEPINFEIPPYK